jgi:DNA modification methylase
MEDAELLVHNPMNPNKHSDRQIELLAKIMDHQGWRAPIVVSNRSGFIVSGHGRLMAAMKLGWKKVPVSRQDFKDEAQEYSHLIADNKIASMAEHDDNAMIDGIKTLGITDFELLGLDGFSLPEVIEPQCDEDEVPEQVDTRCKLGDVWTLGRHRLMCGDSTSIDAVDALMAGEKADITFTSPPYNLGDNAKLRGYNGDGEDTVYTEKSDHKSQDEYLSFLGAWTMLALKHSTTVFNNVQVLAGNKLAIPKYWMSFHDKLIDVMVWDKEHAPPQMAARVLNSVWEFIFIFTDEHEPKRSIKTGKTFRGTIDNIFRLNPNRGTKDESSKTHGAVFPVAFAEHFINNFSDKSVLDLFGGSGSTLIACEKTNRKCFMMELDPHYCDVILARWEKYTGQKAERVNG